MKYKVLGIMACIIVVCLTFVIATTTDPKENRYHQHMEAEPKAACTDHGDEVFCTHLPLIEIDTQNVEIPGKVVVNEDGTMSEPTTTSNGEKQISATIEVTDFKDVNNHINDVPATTSEILINVRGNSSRTFDKSSYDIRLVTETGDNNAQEMMGMPAHHEWVLYGPYLDKSLIRNYMWYNISGEIMDYAPNVRFCEVMLNGEYQGLYLMCESVTAGDNGARLDLSVDKKDNTFSGYVLRLDRGSDTEIKNIDSFTAYALRTKMLLNIEYPGTKNLTTELVNSIEQDFSDFEKSLYSFDYNNKTYGYTTSLDVQSFVDYYIINEFTSNYDAGWLSTYIYKDLDEKYHMCVWDFNSSCDNYIHPTDLKHFEMQNGLWFNMLMKDEDFTDAIIKRYRQLRKSYLNEEYLYEYMDGVIAYLGDAIDRNYEVWGYLFEEDYDLIEPSNRNPRSYEAAVDSMKNFISARGKWMDENIETLRQYSAESKVKKFNEHTE